MLSQITNMLACRALHVPMLVLFLSREFVGRMVLLDSGLALAENVRVINLYLMCVICVISCRKKLTFWRCCEGQY